MSIVRALNDMHDCHDHNQPFFADAVAETITEDRAAVLEILSDQAIHGLQWSS